MQQGSGFQQTLELDEAAARGLRAGDVLDSGEEVRERGFISAGIRTENDLVRIVNPESDGVAVLKLAALHLFAIDEKAASLSAIFDVKAARFDDDRGAVARDAPVGKLQMVAGLGAPSDHEGSLRDAGIAARAVWGDDFEHGFADQGNGIRHGAVPTGAL